MSDYSKNKFNRNQLTHNAILYFFKQKERRECGSGNFRFDIIPEYSRFSIEENIVIMANGEYERMQAYLNEEIDVDGNPINNLW